MMLLWLALAAAPDEVALWSPVPLNAPVEVHADATPAPVRVLRAVALGAFGGGVLRTGQQLGGGGGGLELTLRLPFAAQRFALLLSPHVNGMSGSASDRVSQSVWLSVPLGVGYFAPLGLGEFRIRAALAFDVLFSRSIVANARQIDEQVLSFGPEAGLGYVLPAGPGALSAELAYHLLTTVLAETPERSHAFFLRVGYAFTL